MPTIEVDGRSYECPPGATVLEVCRANGVWIPTLCYHPAVTPYGACRLCLVEVEQHGRKRIVTSCIYPARDGLVVRTQAERAVRARKGMMELLLARAPENATLRAMAARLGVGEPRLPTVTESQRDCILCGLCVNVCREVIGAAAIGFSERGAHRAIAAPFRQPSEACVGCGVCALICPVGTIQLRWTADTVEVSPFKSKVPLRNCAECGAVLTGAPFAEALAEKLAKAPDAAELCPECKRRRYAAECVKVAAASGACGR